MSMKNCREFLLYLIHLYNVRGEPIVCSPDDAIKCFLGTQIDALIIENFVVEK